MKSTSSKPRPSVPAKTAKKPAKKKLSTDKRRRLRELAELKSHLKRHEKRAAEERLKLNQSVAPVSVDTVEEKRPLTRYVEMFQVTLTRRDDCPDKILVIAWSMNDALTKVRRAFPQQRPTWVSEYTNDYPGSTNRLTVIVE